MNKANSHKRQRVLAIASGGGHWVQLNRLLPAFEGQDVVFVCVDKSYRQDVPGQRYYTVPDATRWNKIRLVHLVISLCWLMVRVRPTVVITTGAAPGYLAIRIGKLVGARTVWIDSIANVEHLSLSGQRIGKHADLWLTQWKHLATPAGPAFAGSVL